MPAVERSSNSTVGSQEHGNISFWMFYIPTSPALESRKPLLIDPSKEQPWLYIDFDPETGNLVARFDPVTGDYSVKGEWTLTTLKLDQREVLAVGYRKAFIRLTRKVQRFLDDSIDANQLLLKLQEEDDHGLALLGWIFLGTGKTIDPFQQLQTLHPEVYSDLSKAMTFSWPLLS